MEERGQYITVLCLQHQLGHLSEKTIRLSLGSVSVDVLNKLSKDADGNYFNERMEEEIKKRQHFIDTRYFNGVKGGRPKKPNKKPNRKPKNNLSEDINENRSIIDNEWLKWKEFKKAEFNFNYKSDISESAAKKELMELSENNEEIAIKIIEQSIAKGWKGFFKLKQNGINRGNNEATTEQLAAVVYREFESGKQD
jgi:hypothetical protein